MDHQFQIRQIDAARRDIGGDTDARAAVSHGLKSVGAFVLTQLAGQRYDGKPPVGKAACHVVDGGAGGAKHQCAWCLEISQYIDYRVLPVVGRNGQGAVFDVAVLFAFRCSCDAHCIFLVALGQISNAAWHRGRKHQGAPVRWRGVQDVFQIVAEAEIQHLVGFVQYNCFERCRVQRPALNVITQPSWRADDDMRPPVQRAAFGAHVHTTDAGRNGSARNRVQPFQFTLDLQRQLPCGCHHQRQRRRPTGKSVRAVQ